MLLKKEFCVVQYDLDTYSTNTIGHCLKNPLNLNIWFFFNGNSFNRDHYDHAYMPYKAHASKEM